MYKMREGHKLSTPKKEFQMTNKHEQVLNY